MGDDTDIKVAVAVLQEKVATLVRQSEQRAIREWGLIVTGLGLVGTIILKSL